MKRYLIFLIKILITGSLLFWFFSRSNFGQVWQLIGGLPWWAFLLAIVISLVSLATNSVKWRLLLPDLPWTALFKTNLIGQYYSTLLPGQLAGEVAKAYLLGRGKQQIERITASVIIDKVTGLLGAVFVVGIFGLALTSQALPKIWLIIFASIGLCLAGLLASIRSDYFYSVISHGLDFLEQRFKFVLNFWSFLRKLITAWRSYVNQPTILIASIFWGVFYQVFSILMTLVLASHFGLSVAFIDWCWIWAVLSLVLLLPITIAGLGLREGTLVGILGLLGVLPAQALALSLSLFAVQIIIAMFGGLIEFYRWSCAK